MKKIKGALFITMLIAVSAISCKKDKTGTDDNASAAATVTVGNYGFDGTGGASFKSTKAGIVQAGKLWTLTAIKDGSNESITIILSNVNGTGTYKLDQENNDGNGAIMLKDYTKADAAAQYSTEMPATGGMTGGGEVNITKLTGSEAEGTFYIVAHNSSGKDAFAENGKFSGKLTTTGK